MSPISKRIFAVGGATSSFGGALFMAFGPTAYAQYAAVAVWGGIIAVVVGALMMLLSFNNTSASDRGEDEMGDSYNNSGNNFGHMGPVNNFGPQRLQFTKERANELLLHLPEKKPVHLRVIGGDADQQVGNAFQGALERSGYHVQRSIVGMLVPPPSSKIHVAEDGSSYLVTIAPSAI